MDKCPKCQASWIGGPIPEELRQYYSEPYHWKREIGIDGGRMGIYDGIVAIRCPDCTENFPVSNHKVHLEMFEKYKKLLD